MRLFFISQSVMFESQKYIVAAAKILKAHPSPLLILAGMGLLFYLPARSETGLNFGIFLPLLLFMIIYPLAYGQYSEWIVHGRPLSYYHIFKADWLNYFIVALITRSPAVLLLFFGSIFKEYAVIAGNVLSSSIEILTVYVIPLVFILKNRLPSISLGIKCFLGNLSFSIPLVVLTMVPALFGLTIQSAKTSSEQTLITTGLGYCFWLVAIFVDFLVFASATLILKEKLLSDRSRNIIA